MFQTGGGGFDLPIGSSPLELLVMLLVLVGLIWLMFRLFS
jgi:hypothetical protein